jgi:hypothetical protein
MPRKRAAAAAVETSQEPSAAAEPASAVARARTREAARWVDPPSLVVWTDNPKRPTPREIRGVAQSIIRFGFGAPLVARLENSEIIAGHTRLLAVRMLPQLLGKPEALPPARWHQDARELAEGKGQLPVRFLDISEHDAHILAIADNELGADHDPELLLQQLGELKDEERKVAGWAIEKYAELVGEHGQPEDDDEPEERGRGGRRLLGGLKYQVIVTCEDEDQQTLLIEKLELEGFACKPLVT